MKRTLRRIFVVAVLIELTLAANCLADGLMREVMGTIPGGRGGTNIAYPGNGMSVYANPAALAGVEGSMAEVNFDFVYFIPHFENNYNDEEKGDIWVAMPTGLLSPSYVQKVDDRFAFGVGLFHPAGCATDYELQHPIFGAQDYESYAALSELLIAGSFKPTDSLSFGIGVGPAYSKEEIHAPYTFQTGSLAGVSALLDLDADDQTVTWNIGMQWQAAKGTTIGIAYHPERRFRMEGDVKLDLNNMNALLPTPLPDPVAHYDVDYDLVWPQTVAIGVMQQITDAFNVSAEFTWYGWQRAFSRLKFKLTDGDNPGYDFAAGTESPKDTLPVEWKDAYSVKLGGEYAVTENDTVRVGFVYEKNPISDDTLMPILPAICRYEVNGGYTHSWENVTVSGAVGYIFGPEQHIDTGESKIVDTVGQYDDAKVDFEAYFVSLGVQYRF